MLWPEKSPFARTPATDETASSSTFAWFGGPWEKKRLQPTVFASLAHQKSQVIDSSQDHEPYRDIAQLLAIGLETLVDSQNPTPVELLQTKKYTHTLGFGIWDDLPSFFDV